VDDVASNLDAEVTADGAGQGVSGVGGAEHLATGLDHIQTLPHHGHHGAGVHVVDESGEEGAGGQIGVVLLQQLLGGLFAVTERVRYQLIAVLTSKTHVIR